MSQSKVKSYRRTVKHTMKNEYTKYMYDYIEKLCNQPLKTRLHFLWFILLKKNPHTGKKYENS